MFSWVSGPNSPFQGGEGSTPKSALNARDSKVQSKRAQ